MVRSPLIFVDCIGRSFAGIGKSIFARCLFGIGDDFESRVQCVADSPLGYPGGFPFNGACLFVHGHFATGENETAFRLEIVDPQARAVCRMGSSLDGDCSLRDISCGSANRGSFPGIQSGDDGCFLIVGACRRDGLPVGRFPLRGLERRDLESSEVAEKVGPAPG